MNHLIRALLVVSVLVISGCAHQIKINPNTDRFNESNNKIDSVVGYYISAEDRKKKVTTPGGGGDKVTYTPYKDTEAVLYQVLSNKFKDVYSVSSLEDKVYIQQNNISYVFIPTILTDSSSDSFVTWPPTRFMIDLTLKVIDQDGNEVWNEKMSGEGQAEYDEFKFDFSLSARRATEKVFAELAEKLESDFLTHTKTAAVGE